MPETYDFGGYATKNDIRCMDGRIIRKGAFDECNGKTVPLVWQHEHGDPTKVLGHGILETRDDGTYVHASFNDSEMGKHAKELVRHGDVKALSIYANELKQRGGEVLHGVIREVSLCLAGANPGAYIDDLSLEHSFDEDYEDGEAIIYNGENLELAHAAEKKEEPKEMAEETKKTETGEKTVQDVIDSMNEEQKNVMYYMVGKAMEDAGDDDEGETEMKHNVFEKDTPETSLSHADLEKLVKDGKRLGSLREAVYANIEEGGALSHAVFDENGNEVKYGIANLEYLFPDYQTVGEVPQFIRRDDDWVNVVMNGVHHSAFARIKSIFANITMEEARARGYLKGTKKKEEVFSLLKRTTEPTTVYKKQKMDRDDLIDLNSTEPITMMKREMREMLNEELARAYLFGDGRLVSDPDHIDDTKIRPVWTDDDLFVVPVGVTAGADNAATAKNMIKAIIRGFENYEGSGNPVMFTTQAWLTEMLLLEDQLGHFLYPDKTKLATTLQVSKIVTVPVMKGLTRNGHPLAAIILDLKDYNVGTNRGGEVSFFDDFDLDFNQQKWLIETRCSGALTKPFSAMVVEIGGTAPTYTAVTPEEGDNPKGEGWYEKEGDIYRKSGDTEAKTGKTYYARS